VRALRASPALPAADGRADEVREAQRLRHRAAVGEPGERPADVVRISACDLKRERAAPVEGAGRREERQAAGRSG
jgi:hypothetical protein